MELKLLEDLRVYKEVNKLSYFALGERIGLSKMVTYDLLNARRKFIDLPTLQRIFVLLGQEVRNVTDA